MFIRRRIFIENKNKVKINLKYKETIPNIKATENNVNTYIKIVKLDGDAPVSSDCLVQGKSRFREQNVTFL